MDRSSIITFGLAFVLGAGISYFALNGSNSDALPIAAEATEPQAVVVVEKSASAAEPAPIVDAPAGTEAAAAGAPTEKEEVTK